jgi:hypothetical protein
MIIIKSLLCTELREGLKWKARRTKVELLRVVMATNGSRAQPDKNQLLDEDL